MKDKKKSILSKVLIQFIMAIPVIFGLISHAFSLIEWEAQRAKRSFVLILILWLVMGSLLTATWLCLLAMFFIYLSSLKLSLLLSLFIIFMLNIFLLLIVSLIILKIKNHLFFPVARRLLRGVSK